MRTEEIYIKIKPVFVEVLEHDRFELTPETTAKDVDGWESVTHMLIINGIEELFGIKFKLMDLMSMNDVKDLVDLIAKEI